MHEIDPRFRPVWLSSAPRQEDGGQELEDLKALQESGLPVATMVLVPAAAEERFYRLNNLPPQLLDVFQRVDIHDPDEDDVEEAVPDAMRLIMESYLLDEFIDDFYEITGGLAPRVRVRRPGADGEVCARGRPALLAYKHVLRDDWSFDAVWQRLERSGGIGLEARPVLLHDAAESDPNPGSDTDAADLAERATQVLGVASRLRLDAEGRITGARRMA